MSDACFDEFVRLEEGFNRAVVSNDVGRIAACISDDWTLVTPEVGPVSRASFLQAVESGALSHDSMTKVIERVKVYDDIAIVTGRGQNSGSFGGKKINADEWVTDVYRKVDDRWLCVLTHLTPAQAA